MPNKNPKSEKMSKGILEHHQKLGLNQDEIDFCDELFSRSGQLKNPNSKEIESKNPVKISENPINNAQNPVNKAKNSIELLESHVR